MPRTGLQVSVLFIVTHGVDLTTEKKSLIEATEQGQALMLEIQRHVFANEGSINKMLVDDKVLSFFPLFFWAWARLLGYFQRFAAHMPHGVFL